ncbi:MAG: thiamine pyrophosphate-binding protein [Tissierellia bacterium]|nr:thiamine pyrophosphate-binding protein [Tissierellia bacterium]
MANYYTDEKNAQIVIALLKEHGIKQVIASPGTTNVTFVRSVQIDPFFEVFSSPDERSAAYMACGLAAESGEPVVLSCTGATASRNYLPGLTEAYYRKLPILAITSTRDISKYGHHEDQVIDRSVVPKDVAKLSVSLPIIKDNNDYWECEIKTNRAILELKRQGGGPVHINIPTVYTRSFETKVLPKVRVVERVSFNDNFPLLPPAKIGVFVGAHLPFNKELTQKIERFCKNYNAVVLCDHTSGYNGRYSVLFHLLQSQHELNKSDFIPEILIHIGEISGYYSSFVGKFKQVWRVSEDGEIRDTFHGLRYVFEMTEQHFFEYYANTKQKNTSDKFLQLWQEKIEEINNKIPILPFSNVWIAQQLAKHLPENSVIHFGILNSLSSWNYFKISQTIISSSNVGGFGIDGCVSAFVGASLANTEKLYFGVFGDLAFFYDMNVIGNRHVGNNLRILLVNNGKGMEFKIKDNPAIQFGNETDEYIAAAGHFGNKSKELVKHYATDLGFQYISASSKDEFSNVYEKFINPELTDKSILFEVFTNDFEENNAHVLMSQIEMSVDRKTKLFAKKILGESTVKTIKKLIK